MLLMGGGVAQASDPVPESSVPPAFVPPAPAPVIDTDSAAAFTEGYAADNAGDFIGVRRHSRVRVLDTNAACLQSPIVDTRFGCVFTLRALVISRTRGWWSHGHSAHKSSRRGHVRHRRHFRVRLYGCLGSLRVNGGPSVTPTVDNVNTECRRIRRGDLEVVAPTDSPEDNS
jgi:hypothetical protein